MLKRFIDTTVRRNVSRLGCYDTVEWEDGKKKRETIICSETMINRRWLAGGGYDKNYDDEDYLDSLRCYEVENKMFEIIVKIYVLSTVGLSKEEIVKNLKKIYNEDEITNAISFLKNNNLIEEYLCIPHKNEVIMEITPRDICYKGVESKKFYTATLYYTQNIAKIGLKTPEIHLSYKIFNDPYYFYISSEPLCFKEIPKSRWDDIELFSTDGLHPWMHFNIINEFMPETFVIENELALEYYNYNEKLGYMVIDNKTEDQIINHKDREAMKKRLLERLLKKIRLFGGKKIVVKDKGPLEINIKYTLRKEIFLPIAVSRCIFPEVYTYLRAEPVQKENESWGLLCPLEIIRKRKRGEKNDYFFIDDMSEDFDDIVVGEQTCDFPCNLKAKFIDYVAKKLKSVGAKLNVIYKKFEV